MAKLVGPTLPWFWLYLWIETIQSVGYGTGVSDTGVWEILEHRIFDNIWSHRPQNKSIQSEN